MKLTAEVLLSAPSHINPIKDRELILRGHKIPVIENLGVTRDLNDVIDLTDNDIRTLGNFPKFTRLSGLLLARNRINHIQPDLCQSLPNLTTLVLSSNNISLLSELDSLSGLNELTFVSLVDNPVTLRANYRLYVIWRNPHIRMLDFQRVKDAERAEATKLFGSHDKPTPLASQISGVRAKTFDAGNGSKSDVSVKLTDHEKAELKEKLKNATSLEEMEKIEAELKRGYMN